MQLLALSVFDTWAPATSVCFQTGDFEDMLSMISRM